jgi:hypothetical protein
MFFFFENLYVFPLLCSSLELDGSLVSHCICYLYLHLSDGFCEYENYEFKLSELFMNVGGTR